jgi:DNA-binding response OmpR family regulator
MHQYCVPEMPHTVIVSPSGEDHRALIEILRPAGWSVVCVRSYAQAARYLKWQEAPVVIASRDLPDGNWKTVLNLLTRMAFPPKLIVAARLADERLWAEVLNLGGFDVLAQPFNHAEVTRSVGHACRTWSREARELDAALARSACSATA